MYKNILIEKTSMGNKYKTRQKKKKKKKLQAKEKEEENVQRGKKVECNEKEKTLTGPFFLISYTQHCFFSKSMSFNITHLKRRNKSHTFFFSFSFPLFTLFFSRIS